MQRSLLECCFILCYYCFVIWHRQLSQLLQ